MGLFSGMFSGGQPDKFQKFDTMAPEQQQVLNQLLQMLGQGGQLGQGYGQALGGLQEMMDPSSAAMQRFTAPHMQQFEQQTMPGIAERFAGSSPMGGGALSSSGFGQALSSAGGQLQTQLAGMKANLQQQAMGDIMGQYGSMLGQGLGAQPFGYQQQQGSPSFGQSLLTGWAQGGMPGMSQGLGALGGAMQNWWNKGN